MKKYLPFISLLLLAGLLIHARAQTKLGGTTPIPPPAISPTVPTSCGAIPINQPPLGTYTFQVLDANVIQRDGIVTYGFLRVSAELNGTQKAYTILMNPDEATAFQADPVYQQNLIVHAAACAEISHAVVVPVITTLPILTPAPKDTDVNLNVNSTIQNNPPTH